MYVIQIPASMSRAVILEKLLAAEIARCFTVLFCRSRLVSLTRASQLLVCKLVAVVKIVLKDT